MKPWLWLSLAPLLGASELLIKALGLSLVALPLLTLGGGVAWILRQQSPVIRTLAALLTASALLAFADLLLQAGALELRSALALYLPLLVVSALAWTEQAPAHWHTGLRHGLLFGAIALLLGALRESLGSGTLLKHGDWLFGSAAGSWTVQIPGFAGLPLLALVPGGFILLGLLLAAGRLVFPSTYSDNDA